jgi:hypothetical protein
MAHPKFQSAFKKKPATSFTGHPPAMNLRSRSKQSLLMADFMGTDMPNPGLDSSQQNSRISLRSKSSMKPTDLFNQTDSNFRKV